MKFIERSDFEFSNHRFIFEVGGNQDAISDIHQPEKEIYSLEEKESVSVEISFQLDSLKSEIEAGKNPKNWPINKQINLLRLLAKGEDVLDDDTDESHTDRNNDFSSLVGSGVDQIVKSLALDDKSEIVNLLSEDALLSFVNFHKTEAWELFTNKSGDGYTVDFLENDFLERQVSLLNIMPSHQKYLMLDGYESNTYFIRTPQGYQPIYAEDNEGNSIPFEETSARIVTGTAFKLLDGKEALPQGGQASLKGEKRNLLEISETSDVQELSYKQNYAVIQNWKILSNALLHHEPPFPESIISPEFISEFRADLDEIFNKNPAQDHVDFLGSVNDYIEKGSLHLMAKLDRSDMPLPEKEKLKTRLNHFFVKESIQILNKKDTELAQGNLEVTKQLLKGIDFPVAGYMNLESLLKAVDNSAEWESKQVDFFAEMRTRMPKSKLVELKSALDQRFAISVSIKETQYIKDVAELKSQQFELRQLCVSTQYIHEALAGKGIKNPLFVDIEVLKKALLEVVAASVLVPDKSNPLLSKLGSVAQSRISPIGSSKDILGRLVQNQEVVLAANYIDSQDSIDQIKKILDRMGGVEAKISKKEAEYRKVYAKDLETLVTINQSAENPESFWEEVDLVYEQKREMQKDGLMSELTDEAGNPLDSSYNLAEIKSQIDNFPLGVKFQRLDENGNMIVGVGQTKQELVLDFKTMEMYPENMDQQGGTMSEYLKFDLDADNIPATQVVSGLLEGNVFKSQKGTEEDFQRMGRDRIQLFFKNLYPFRGDTLYDAEVNSWKNLSQELTERGLNFQDFMGKIGTLKNEHGALNDRVAKEKKISIEKILDAALSNNDDYLDSVLTPTQ